MAVVQTSTKIPIDPRLTCAVRGVQLLSVQGSWHLGQVQVGLSQARRLCRCSHARLTLTDTIPMQARLISFLDLFPAPVLSQEPCISDTCSLRRPVCCVMPDSVSFMLGITHDVRGTRVDGELCVHYIGASKPWSFPYPYCGQVGGEAWLQLAAEPEQAA